MIPISADLSTASLMNFVEEGWQTTGEIVVLNGREYLYYFKDSNDIKINIPASPTADVAGEYIWKRVVVEDSDHLQKEGWIARSVCNMTNRIWLCMRR